MEESSSRTAFLQSLTETDLYAMGAYFCEHHAGLIDEVLEQSQEIEDAGLQAYAEERGIDLQTCFQTLLTGLAVRYFRAVAG
jgi:hypothetical protein